MKKTFASLERAIDMLSLFSTARQGLSALEISKSLSIPLSTTYKYLQIFLEKEFLTKDEETKRFYLGLSIFKMGILAGERISLLKIAHPHLNALAGYCEETVLLVVPHGREILCLDAIESPRMIKLTIKKGTTLPFHAGAPGKVLLAYQDESFIDAVIQNPGLIKLNENTITDPVQLSRELSLIKQQRYCQSHSEVDSGAAALAAPIFGHNGGIAAGLAIAGPADRILGENKEKLLSGIIQSARTISAELGYDEGRMNQVQTL